MTGAGGGPNFDEPRLAAAVESLADSDIDALPFGAIRLDDAGAVAFYSRAERELSGIGGRHTLGRNFFTEIAPCMDNDHFRGRVEQARAQGQLDIAFTFYGDFDDDDKPLSVRIQSASGGGYWMFIRRDD